MSGIEAWTLARLREVADVMGRESLEGAIQRVGAPVELLRNSAARPHIFPVAPEFTNWRSEQKAWRTACVLFDQSHHMTDLYLSGRDALRLVADFGVNTFASFVPARPSSTSR